MIEGGAGALQRLLMISRQRLACAAGSPLPTVCPSGPSGAVPDTAMIDPTRTAREMPTFGSYGLPLEINFLMILKRRSGGDRDLIPCRAPPE